MVENIVFPFGFLGRGSGGKRSLGPKRPENMPFGIFSAEAGPEGPGEEKERFPPESSPVML